MNIMHFYPDSSGIRFLKWFKAHLTDKYKGDYYPYTTSSLFLEALESRVNNTDIVLITSHGTSNFFIGEMERGRTNRITLNKLSAVVHSFVFAFSCSTADLGEALCRDNHAIAFLG